MKYTKRENRFIPLKMEYLFFLKCTKRGNRFIPLKMKYLFSWNIPKKNSFNNGISIFLEKYKKGKSIYSFKNGISFLLEIYKGIIYSESQIYDVFFYAQNNDVKQRVYDAVPSDPLPTL